MVSPLCCRRVSSTSPVLAWLCLIAVSWRCGAAETTSPSTVVPPGFVIEQVAGPPLVHHPLMACFDNRGRLYVSDAAGVNLDETELQQQLPNGIRRLEDTDGDGRFDRSTVFADRMIFPNGGVWHGDSLYVASAPYIWRLRDRDDDGVAEERTPIVGQFGFIGNAADIHGCFLGPEGRIWWCDGRHGHEVRNADGVVISQGEAARIFSSTLDGSDLRTHCGGGMDNPVEVDFTRTGELLGTVNLFYQTRGDCLVHWLHGGVYPRDDQPQCLAEFRRTGELLGPVLDYGHVAVSGLTRYRGDHFGAEFQNGYFVCEFNTHLVNFTRVAPENSTYVAERNDFLRFDSVDFHPTDVLEDADGSLLVIDTGGWFRYGCPTSQVAKPEIAGGIYRIRRQDGPSTPDPRGLALNWDRLSLDALAELLGDPRIAVRERAQHALVDHGQAAIPALKSLLQHKRAESRLLALWALHRLKLPDAQDVVREQLGASDPELRQVAARCAGEARDPLAAAMLVELLHDEHPAVRRSAAEALGRCNAAGVTPPLLDAVGAAVDRAEEHSAVYALIELGDRPALAAGLRHDQPSAQRAALLALDQVAPDEVVREDVLSLLGSADPLTVRTAMDAVAKRPTWTDEMPAFWRRWLSEPVDAARAPWLIGALKSFAADERTQAVIAEAVASDSAAPEVRQLLLSAIEASELAPLPESWIAALSAGCDNAPSGLRQEFLRVAAVARDGRLLGALQTSANSDDGAVRTFALAGLAGLGQTLSDRDWGTLLSTWGSETEAAQRETLAASIARAYATDSQLLLLAATLNQAQPLELSVVLPAFRRSQSSEVGIALTKALANHSGTPLVSYPELRAAFVPYPSDVQEAAAALLAKHDVISVDQQARLSDFDARDSHGNIDAGREVFFGTKAGCSSCHRLATRGGVIGPDMTHIGRIRTRRDLGESILYPSLTLARGYDMLLAITTTEGLSYSGLVERATKDSIHLRTAQRELLRMPRAQIEDQATSKTSIMPQGFDELLSDEELDDLVAFLLSLK